MRNHSLIPTPKAALLAALTAGALCAIPAVASASTYCVNDNACAAKGGVSVGTVDAALEAAGKLAGNDDVHIGPGVYLAAASYVHSTGVTITGAGQDRTVIQPREIGKPVINVDTFGMPATISDLTVQLRGNNQKGLGIASGTTATRVRIVANTSINGATGIETHGGRIMGVTIKLAGSFNDDRGISLLGTGGTVSDSDISAGIGVQSTPASGATIQPQILRSKVTGDSRAVVAAGGNLRIDNSLLTVSEEGSRTLLVTNPTATVVTGRSNTILGDNTAEPGETAILIDGTSSKADVRVNLQDTIIDRATTPVIRRSASNAGTASLRLDHVFHQPIRADLQQGPGSITELSPLGGGNAGYADVLARDFHLAPTSRLLDAGTRGAAAGGPEGRADLDGRARVMAAFTGGPAIRDVGAYELLAGKGIRPKPAK